MSVSLKSQCIPICNKPDPEKSRKRGLDNFSMRNLSMHSSWSDFFGEVLLKKQHLELLPWLSSHCELLHIGKEFLDWIHGLDRCPRTECVQFCNDADFVPHLYPAEAGCAKQQHLFNLKYIVKITQNTMHS